MDRNIFGVPFADFDNEQLRIIVENPKVRAWFEQNTRNNHIRERYLQNGSLRSKLINLVKVASGVAGVGTAIKASLTNNPRSEQATPGGLRGNTPDTIMARKSLKFDEMEVDASGDTQMAVEMSKAFSSARASVAGGGGTTNTIGGGETAIDKQKPHYGLPMTTTVVLPYTAYFTAVTNSNQNIYNIFFRLNSIYDPLISLAVTPTAGAALTAGMYNRKAGTGGNWPGSLVEYPTSLPNGGPTNEAPQWRNWYAKLYNKYAVLGCEYELVMHNPRTSISEDVVVAAGVETLSAANGGRVYPNNVPISNAEYWPGLEWKVVKSTNDQTSESTYATIKGYYKPGSKETNVQNDEDIKTWTTVGSTPTLEERMNLMFAQAAFNQSQGCRAVDCKLKLSYTVQFKDLTVNAMYPASQTAISLNLPADVTLFQ